MLQCMIYDVSCDIMHSKEGYPILPKTAPPPDPGPISLKLSDSFFIF